VLKPIVSGGGVVGYLGYVPQIERLQSLERVYLTRQRLAFAVVELGMLLAAVGLAAGLAYWLTRRVRALVQTTNALIRGDYTVRLTPRGGDELAQLAGDFNTLAAARPPPGSPRRIARHIA
jgi:two-component system sensor histidine kinase BaeS